MPNMPGFFLPTAAWLFLPHRLAESRECPTPHTTWPPSAESLPDPGMTSSVGSILEWSHNDAGLIPGRLWDQVSDMQATAVLHPVTPFHTILPPTPANPHTARLLAPTSQLPSVALIRAALPLLGLFTLRSTAQRMHLQQKLSLSPLSQAKGQLTAT